MSTNAEIIKRDDLIERLRYRVDNYTVHYGTSDRDLDKLILALLRALPSAGETE